jgi:RNA polymerase sigma-70 factor (ECF subfamily)
MNPSDRVWRERGLRTAVLAGDERAWQTWYDESYAGLAAYVTWRCAGLHDLRDEMVQETWLTAIRRLRSFDPEQGSFAGWLQGIAAKLLANHFRRQARRRLHEPSRNGHRALAPGMDQLLEQRERAERIARALALLPEHYEAVLRAKYLEQQSMADIAAQRHETVKAIESLLTRARQAFRAAYGQEEPA